MTDEKKQFFTSKPEVSIEVRLIKERLKKLGLDDFIPYKELNELIGRDVQHQARGSLEKAKFQLLKEQSMLFACVIGQGQKRLTDSGIVKSGESAIKGIKRKTRRAILNMTALRHFEELTNEEKFRHQAQLSILGTLELMTKESTVKKIGHQCEQTGSELPIGKTMELFQ